jgi:hypothetical protein
MVSQNYMLSVIRLMSCAKSAEFDVSLTMLGSDALISRARSTLVAAFLDNPAATHLLFVDADISFEPQQVERMLRFDKDFTGALYPLKSMDWDLVRNVVSSAEKTYGRLRCPMLGLSRPTRNVSRRGILSRDSMPVVVFK